MPDVHPTNRDAIRGAHGYWRRVTSFSPLARRPSVSKMTNASKNHCKTGLIGGGDNFVVSQGSAGLNDGRGASFRSR